MSSLWKKAAAAALLLGSGLAEAQETTITTTASSSIQTTVTTTATSSSASCATLTPSYDAPVAADGWKAQLIATGLTKPRGIKFDSNGGLLVIEAGVGLRRLTFTDNGGTCLSLKGNTSVITDDEVSLNSHDQTQQTETDPRISSTTALSCQRMARPSTSPRTRTSTATATTPTRPPSAT